MIVSRVLTRTAATALLALGLACQESGTSQRTESAPEADPAGIARAVAHGSETVPPRTPEARPAVSSVVEPDARPAVAVTPPITEDTSAWHKAVPRPSSRTKEEKLEELYDEALYRLTYPTGTLPRGDWRGQAMAHVRRAVPENSPQGVRKFPTPGTPRNTPDGVIPPVASWTEMGPKPLDSVGTTNNAYQYGIVAGRANIVAFQPGSSTVAYAGFPVGGLWKTTNCCSASTTWTQLWNDSTFPAQSVSSVAIDPVDSNVIYAGTGDSHAPHSDMFSNGVYKSIDGGATWTQHGAEVFSPYTSPGAPGLTCCVNGPDQNIHTLAIDPNDRNTILAGASYGLFISRDAGVTWTQYDIVNRNAAPYNIAAQRVTSILIDGATSPSTAYVAVGVPYTYYTGLTGGANGVYKATIPASGAPTFTLMANGWPAGTGDGTNSSNVGRIELAWNAAHTRIYAHASHYANVGQTLGIYHTANGGTNWNLLTGSTETNWSDCGNSNETDQAWYDLAIAVDPNDDKIIYTGRTNLWKATVNSTYTSVTLLDLSAVYATGCAAYGSIHPDQHTIAMVPGSNPTRFLVGNDGGVYFATGAAGGFTQLNNTISTNQFYAGQIGRDFANTSGTTQQWAMGGMQDNGNATWDSSATNIQWTGRSVGGDGFFTAFDPVGGSLTTGRWLTEYTDGDVDCSSTGADGPFSACAPGYAANERRDWSTPFLLDQWNCTTTSCGNLVLGSNFVWASTNAATSWTKTTTTDLTKGTTRSTIISINVAHNNPGSVVIGTNDGTVQWSNNVFTGGNCTAAAANSASFACTANNAATWVNLTGSNAVLPNRVIPGVVFAPDTNLKFYAAVGGFNTNTPTTPGHLFMGSCSSSPCTTGNITWTDKTGNLPDIPFEAVQVNPNSPNQVFAGSMLGFFYTNDITANPPVWNRYQSGMPNARITYLAVDRGADATPRASTTLAAYTYGRGVYTALIAMPACAAPAAPTNLAATVPQNNRITLNWTASAGAASYKIYRIESGTSCPVNGYTYLATVTAPTTTYNDNDVSGGSRYSYRVTAVGSGGCESVQSGCSSALATGACTLPPNSPTNFTLSAPQNASCVIDLAWSAGSSRCGGTISYNVYRSTTSPVVADAGNRIASGLTTTSYSDTALTPGTYYYLVRAYDSATAREDVNTTELTGTPAGTAATTQLYFQNFDSLAAGNLAGFVLSGTGTTDWRGVAACSPNQSAANIFRFGGNGCTNNYGSNDNARASINGAAGFAIPAGKTNVRLEFYHRWLFEAGWDGGSIEIMRGGDAGWTYVPAAAILSGTQSYTGSANSRSVFTGTANNASMYLTRVDLDAACNLIAGNIGGCAGKTIFVAFAAFSDGLVTDDGWYIDDVKITYDTVTPCTTACTPPTAATVSANANAAQQITVSLTAPGDGATFNLYRAMNDTSCPVGGTAIATGLTAASFPYVDSGLTIGASYTYQIESVGSNPACKTKGNCTTAIAWGDCVAAPTFAGLTSAAAAAGTTCGIDLAWSAGSSNCGGSVTYSIYRSQTNGFTPSAANRIAAGVTGTSFTDTAGLAPGVAYYYVAHAVDTQNNVESAANVQRSTTTVLGCSGAPIAIQLFTVTSTGTSSNGRNLIQWINPANGTIGSTVTINFRTDTYPTGPNDPAATDVVRNRAMTFGAVDSVEHTGISLGTTYYYAIWVRY